jgi:hypothetical protein
MKKKYKQSAEKTAVYARKYRLKKYGLTEAEYESKLEAQNGRCSICDIYPEPDRRLAVDHDHKTEQTRELLCTRCNVLLGLVGDNIKLLLTAIEYLQTWR